MLQPILISLALEFVVQLVGVLCVCAVRVVQYFCTETRGVCVKCWKSVGRPSRLPTLVFGRQSLSVLCCITCCLYLGNAKHLILECYMFM